MSLFCLFGMHKWYKSPDGMLCSNCGVRMHKKSQVGSSSQASDLTAPVKMPASRSRSAPPAAVKPQIPQGKLPSSPQRVETSLDLFEMLYDLGSFVQEKKIKAASALGILGDPRAVEALIEALEEGGSIHRSLDEKSALKDAAAVALGQIGDPRAVEPLIKALDDKYSLGVRKSAAVALGQLGDSRAVEPLIKAMMHDHHNTVFSRYNIKSTDVVVAAIVALGQIGDPISVKPLVEALDIAILSVQKAVIVALIRLCDLGVIVPLHVLQPLVKIRSDASLFSKHVPDEAELYEVATTLLERLGVDCH